MTGESSGDGASREPLAAFAELSKIMLGDGSLNETLGRIAALARETVPDTDEVSGTLVDHDKAKTVVFTGQLAMHLDERQYENDRGPCLDAALTGSGETVIVDVVAEDSLYPDFAHSARRAGVTHSVSVGLPVPQRVVGALNLYTSTSQPLAEEIISLAQAFASYAGVAVANAALYSHTAELANQMRAAMESRAVIEQAKGILMARHRYTADDAFKNLSRLSQNSNRKLRDIAQSIVDGTRSDQSHRTRVPADELGAYAAAAAVKLLSIDFQLAYLARENLRPLRPKGRSVTVSARLFQWAYGPGLPAVDGVCRVSGVSRRQDIVYPFNDHELGFSHQGLAPNQPAQ